MKGKLAELQVYVCLQCGRPGFDPWDGKIPWRRKWQTTAELLPGKPHGQRSLVGYSPWGLKELDTTEQLHFTYLYICKVSILYWCFSFWLTSLCIIGSSFIHFIRTDSNAATFDLENYIQLGSIFSAFTVIEKMTLRRKKFTERCLFGIELVSNCQVSLWAHFMPSSQPLSSFWYTHVKGSLGDFSEETLLLCL